MTICGRRPRSAISRAGRSANRRRPIAPPQTPAPHYPHNALAAAYGTRSAPAELRRAVNGPVSLACARRRAGRGRIDLPPEGAPARGSQAVGALSRRSPPIRRATAIPGLIAARRCAAAAAQPAAAARAGAGNPVAAVGPVAVKPAATLACPIVSVLDRWLAEFRAAGGACAGSARAWSRSSRSPPIPAAA